MSSNFFHSGKIFSLGDRIKAIRGKLNQEEFGKIIGVKAPAISKYEKGRVPDLETLKKIADYGGVTLEWLLEGDKAPGAATVYTRWRKIPSSEALPEEPGDEGITIESPPPGASTGRHDPYLFGGLDIGALTRIIEMVEDHLLRRQKPLKPVKKALLLSLLYDEYQKSGRPLCLDTLREFLRKVE